MLGWLVCLCLLNVLWESTTVDALPPARVDVESTIVSHFSKNKVSPKSYYVDGEYRNNLKADTMH